MYNFKLLDLSSIYFGNCFPFWSILVYRGIVPQRIITYDVEKRNSKLNEKKLILERAMPR